MKKYIDRNMSKTKVERREKQTVRTTVILEDETKHKLNLIAMLTGDDMKTILNNAIDLMFDHIINNEVDKEVSEKVLALLEVLKKKDEEKKKKEKSDSAKKT